MLAVVLLAATPARAAVDSSTFRDLAFRQHPGAQLPLATPLLNSHGRSLTLANALGGKPAIVVLEYLRCTNLCGVVLAGAAQAISNAGLVPGRDVNFVAISIDPRDSPADAARAETKYRRLFEDPGAAAGVRFYSSRPEQVRKIAGVIGFPYRYDKGSDQFLHPAGFVVTTPAGKISRYILGLSPQALLLKSAVEEARRNRIKPPAHPLLCLCFGYDPDEGSVAALSWRLVRIVSAGLVVLCGALILFLSFRRRTRA